MRRSITHSQPTTTGSIVSRDRTYLNRWPFRIDGEIREIEVGGRVAVTEGEAQMRLALQGSILLGDLGVRAGRALLRDRFEATGVDARGRKQYRYHPAFRARQDAAKFARLGKFGACLPALRAQVEKDISARGTSRRCVIATPLHSI